MKKISLLKLFFCQFLMCVPVFVLATDNRQNLEFEKGKLSAKVESSIVRGEMDSYEFSAQAGQRLSIAITSYEDNAVFGIFYQESSEWVVIEMTREARAWYGKLPKSESNLYKIEVGGTRGNATYELFVGITVVDYSE